MTNSPAPRIALVGFQGFGNLGDEALLTGIARLLAGSDACVTTVFSGPRPETIGAFPAARRMVTPRHLPTLAALKRLRTTDLLLLAGGGLFNDHWAAVVPRYAAWVFAARLAGARVAWVGVGVGPLSDPRWRWLTRRAAAASQLVLVRDAMSARLLPGTARVIPDPSLFNDRPRRRVVGSELGLIVRAPARRNADRHAPLVAALADAAREAAGRGLVPVLLSMGGTGDAAFAAEVAGALQQGGVQVAAPEVLGPTVEAALARLAVLRQIISVRLHGMLLGALAGVPSIPIAYDQKVRWQAVQLGLDDLTVGIEDVSGAALSRGIERLLADDRRDALQRRVDQLRARRDEIAGWLIAAPRRHARRS